MDNRIKLSDAQAVALSRLKTDGPSPLPYYSCLTTDKLFTLGLVSRRLPGVGEFRVMYKLTHRGLSELHAHWVAKEQRRNKRI